MIGTAKMHAGALERAGRLDAGLARLAICETSSTFRDDYYDIDIMYPDEALTLDALGLVHSKLTKLKQTKGPDAKLSDNEIFECVSDAADAYKSWGIRTMPATTLEIEDAAKLYAKLLDDAIAKKNAGPTAGTALTE